MKTVLVDLTSLNTSQRMRGIGRHVRELATGLSKLAPEFPDIRLIGLLRVDTRGSAQFTEDFGQFDDRYRDPPPNHLDDQRELWGRRLGLSRAATRIGADLVHLPDPLATPFTLQSVQYKKISTCHDLAQIRIRRPHLIGRSLVAIHRRLLARRFLSSDHIIAISTYTADDLRKIFGLTASRTSVVYNGIDLQRWSPQKDVEVDDLVLTKYGLQARHYALYVGAAAWRKNHSGMLRALRHAREARPHLGLQFVWAGRLAAHESSAIDREARNLGIRHAVRLLNYLPDRELAALYRSAAAHLLVSRHEGFGLTVIEAMACGCPVITTRRTALAEVAGDAAVHVEPERHADIGDALIRVASDSQLREDLSQRGIVQAQRFGNERQGRETLDVYSRLLQSEP